MVVPYPLGITELDREYNYISGRPQEHVSVDSAKMRWDFERRKKDKHLFILFTEDSDREELDRYEMDEDFNFTLTLRNESVSRFKKGAKAGIILKERVLGRDMDKDLTNAMVESVKGNVVILSLKGVLSKWAY